MSELIESTKTFADIYEINPSEYEEVSIASLSFSVRVYNRFMRNGITTVKKLLDSTPEKVLSIKGFGKGCVDELYEFLDSLKDKTNNDKINIEYRSIFKSYADSIAMGDFSFADNIEISEEGIALLERYKTTFEILGEDISFDCVASPEKVIPIIEMFDSYNKQVERITELRTLLDMLPEGRKQKMAYGYINAFTLITKILKIQALRAYLWKHEDPDLNS